MSAETKNHKPRPSPTVCLVDPDQALSRRIADLLTTLGADVRLFQSGAELLASGELQPVCVISELRLPDMTGIELIKALRTQKRRMPIILLASDGDVATAVAAMHAGALDFIEKPHVDRLIAWHVQRLLENDEPDHGAG